MTQLQRCLSVVLAILILLGSAVPLSAQDTIQNTYDERGNLISDGILCFEYDGANQLHVLKTCADDQIQAKYFYDHTGHRTMTERYQDGSHVETIINIGDHTEVVIDQLTGQQALTKYIYANGVLLARINPDGSTHFFHTDHLGSITLITDEAGNVVEKTKYYPYGQILVGGSQSKYGYTGQEYDVESQLNYYDSRYYDSQIGRFIQPDSIRPDVYDPQQLNPYAYVSNNPLKYTDPTGNSFVSDFWKDHIQPTINKVIDYVTASLDFASVDFYATGATETAQNIEMVNGIAEGADLYLDLSEVAEQAFRDEELYRSYKTTKELYPNEEPTLRNVELTLSEGYYLDGYTSRKIARDGSYGILKLWGGFLSNFIDEPIGPHNDPEYHDWLESNYEDIIQSDSYPTLKERLQRDENDLNAIKKTNK